ncbi:MAG: DUF4269 domain-containing protein [Bdellovibrionota bacterium]
MNWFNLSYLKTGTPNQQSAYKLLKDHRILELLEDFNPALVSTVCVDLDIEGSDLDIICQYKQSSEFVEKCNGHFSQCDNFSITERDSYSLVNFNLPPFPIEIYGSTIETPQNNAYKHLTAMKRVLDLADDSLREEIRILKRNGFKTEPAFASLLQLKGDPYQAFKKLFDVPNKILTELIHHRITAQEVLLN